MMKIWGIATCDKTKQALRDLQGTGLAPQLADIRAPGLDSAMCAAAVAALGDRLVNRSSTTWRALSEDDQSLPVEALVARHPTVIKRPLILHDGEWTVGWTPAVKARFGL